MKRFLIALAIPLAVCAGCGGGGDSSGSTDTAPKEGGAGNSASVNATPEESKSPQQSGPVVAGMGCELFKQEYVDEEFGPGLMYLDDEYPDGSVPNTSSCEYMDAMDPGDVDLRAIFVIADGASEVLGTMRTNCVDGAGTGGEISATISDAPSVAPNALVCAERLSTGLIKESTAWVVERRAYSVVMMSYSGDLEDGVSVRLAEQIGN